jgi:hypothetical protein
MKTIGKVLLWILKTLGVAIGFIFLVLGNVFAMLAAVLMNPKGVKEQIQKMKNG